MLYILFVIYNKKIIKNKIFDKKSKDVKFIIFDNSTDVFTINENKKFANEFDYIYYSSGKNIGLSKAYNLIIKNILKDDDWILILDDDTSLDDKYVDVVLNRIKESNSLVFSPINIERKSNKIDSPKIFVNSKILKSQEIELHDHDLNYYNSINNGTVISKKVFDIIGFYDEDLFVYFTDAYFYAMLFINNIKTEIIDYKNFCDFSIRASNYKEIKNRLKIIKKDACVFYKIIYKKLNRPYMGKIHYYLFFAKKTIECSKQTSFLYFFPYLFTKKLNS